MEECTANAVIRHDGKVFCLYLWYLYLCSEIDDRIISKAFIVTVSSAEIYVRNILSFYYCQYSIYECPNVFVKFPQHNTSRICISNSRLNG
jgi:hypothetical protein